MQCAWPKGQLLDQPARLCTGQLLERPHTFTFYLAPEFVGFLYFNLLELPSSKTLWSRNRLQPAGSVTATVNTCRINLQESLEESLSSKYTLQFLSRRFRGRHMFSTPFLAVPMRRVARDATAVATVKHILSRMSSPRLT